MECVASCAETSMQQAVDEVKSRPEYSRGMSNASSTPYIYLKHIVGDY